jgi:hypothetical protein
VEDVGKEPTRDVESTSYAKGQINDEWRMTNDEKKATPAEFGLDCAGRRRTGEGNDYQGNCENDQAPARGKGLGGGELEG